MSADQQAELNNLAALLESGAISREEFEEMARIIYGSADHSATENSLADQSINESLSNNFIDQNRETISDNFSNPESSIFQNGSRQNQCFSSSIIKVCAAILLLPISIVSMKACGDNFSDISSPNLIFEKWAAGIAFTLIFSTPIYFLKKRNTKNLCYLIVFYQTCITMSLFYFSLFPIAYIFGLFYSYYFK